MLKHGFTILPNLLSVQPHGAPACHPAHHHHVTAPSVIRDPLSQTTAAAGTGDSNKPAGTDSAQQRRYLFARNKRADYFICRLSTLRLGVRLFLLCSLLTAALSAEAAQLCSIPGKDGPGAPSGVINTYYPGTASVSAGATAIQVGAPAGNVATPIQTGDLLLVMQMQDADINFTNGDTYGSGGAAGAGYTSINQTGVYEYVTAAGSVSGGSVPLASGLVNSYRRRTATATNGQSTFQVIRVPQYSTATVAGTASALYWDGSVGGVIAMDVAGTLTVNGTITASGAGFRGGWGEYSTSAPAAGLTTFFTRATSQGNGMKGEGIAGSPNRMNQPTAFNGVPRLTTSGSLGYPGGGNSDAAKGLGAPGNAGGGGTDGTTNNDENSGGGGGGNYAAGAKGGNSWNSNDAVGGNGGSAVGSLAFNRVVMGGGGGAGTSNNDLADNTTYPSPTPPGLACSNTDSSCSSGAPGGGIVLLRANSMAGSGTISANGGSGYNAAQDAAGGGGAAGSIVLYTQTGGSATVQANGGDGGNAWRSHTTLADRHGPGGGGSGGFIAYSPSTGFSVVPYFNGGTSGRSCLDDPYGSTSSSGGISTFQTPSTSGPKPGAACLPRLTVTKSTTTPTIASLPGTASYSISIANAAGTSTANNVTITDLLPGAPALFTNSTAAPTITYNPNAAPCNTSRTATTNAAVGTSTPSWSNWNIPTGCTITLPFSVSVPAATVASVYQNPVTVTYDDPVNVGLRTSASYDPASSTAEDVKVLAPPSLSKAFGTWAIAVGGSTTLTITLVNPNATAITGVTFSDTLPAAATGAPGNMTIVNPPAPASTCGGTPTITAAHGSGTFTVGGSGYTIPAGSSCTITFTVTAPTAGIYVNTIAAGSLASSAGSNVSPATASLTVGTGLLPPTISKTFLTKPILVGGTSTLRFILTNPNATTAIGAAGFIDTLPAELFIATPAGASTTCAGGTVTAVAGTNFISLNTNGTIPAGGSCQVDVIITGTTPGIFTNTSGQVAGDTGAGNRATDTLTVMAPLVVAKNFTANPVATGTATLLTISLTNPNALAVTGAAFSDNYPAGLVNTGSPSAATTCGGSPTITAAIGGTSLVVGGSGVTVPANNSCTVTVNVQSATSGSYTNSTGPVTTANAGTSPAGTATLNVLAPPLVLKSFTPTQISSGGQSNLQLVIGNPVTNTAPLTGVVLTDNYSGTMTNAALCTTAACITCTPGSSATLSGGASGGASVGITAGTIQPGGSCTINQLVTATTNITNTTTAPTATGPAALTGTAATAYLQVLQPLVVSKSFSTYEPGTGTTDVTMTISMYNPNPVAALNVRFTDSYPANMTNSPNNPASPTSPGGSCGAAATETYTSGGNNLVFAAGLIPANSTCTITQLTRFGSNNTSYTNTVTVNTDNLGAASDTAVVTRGSANARVWFTKGFAPNPINPGGTSTLTFTITNPHTAAAITIAFTDPLPAGVTATNATQSVCNGTNNLTVSGNVISMITTGTGVTAGSLPAGNSCTFSINTITANTPGIYNNTTGNISASTGTGGPAAASLTVSFPPTLGKSFGDSSFVSGGATTLTFTLGNQNSSAITTTAVFDDAFPTTPAYPGAMTLANGTLVNNTCGFTPLDTGGAALGAGDTGVRIPNGSSIPADGCFFTVNVTASVAGNYTNTTPALQTSAGSAAAASASVTVVNQPPSVSKAYSPATVAVSGTTTTLITFANPNAAPISLSALFTDTFPTNVTTAATPNRATTCYTGSGALAATGGSANTVTLAAGAIIPAGTPSNPGTCMLQVDVTPSASGIHTNTIPAGAVQTTSGNNANAASAVLTVPAFTPPTVSKAFGSSGISTGMKTTLTITLSNTNPVPATLTAHLDDLLPANLVVASPNGLAGTCPGAVTATAGTSLIRYASGATIPPGGCTIVVTVTSANPAAYTNTINAGSLQTSLGSNPGATTDTLNVVAPNLTVLKTAFGVTSGASAKPGQEIPYVITVTNAGAGMAWETYVADALSPYTAFKLNSLTFTDGSTSSGLSMTGSTTSYSYDNGANWTTTPPADLGGGYNGTVTNWKIVFDPAVLMNGNNAFFTISYQVIVK